MTTTHIAQQFANNNKINGATRVDDIDNPALGAWFSRPAPGTDPISDLLDAVDPGIARVGRLAVRNPWTDEYKAADHVRIGLVERGACYLSDFILEPVELTAGDLYVIGPSVSLAVSTSRAELERVLATGPAEFVPDPTDPSVLNVPDPDFVSISVPVRCAALQRFLDMTQLPAVLSLPASHADARALSQALPLLETLEPTTEVGRTAMASQLTRLIFAIAARVTMNATRDEHCWLQRTRDPSIGKAVVLIHRHPDRPWSVDSLAHEVNMSRSIFYERFVDMMGVTPATYLRQWRVLTGQRLLRDPERTIASVARTVGFSSSSAFIRAYKSIMGTTPRAATPA